MNLFWVKSIFDTKSSDLWPLIGNWMMYDQLERNVRENITRGDIDLILFRSILISIEQNG